MNDGAPSPKSRARRVAGVLLKGAALAVVLYFVGRQLLRGFQAMPNHPLTIRGGYLVAAAACSLLTGSINVVTHRLLLGGLCKPPGWPAVVVSTWIPTMGRYIPGKVASLAGAVWFLRGYGVPGSVAASTVLMRQGLSVITGLLVAGPLVLWAPIRQRMPFAWPVCGVLLVVGLVCLHPRVFQAMTGLLLRAVGRPPLAEPSWGRCAAASALMCVNWSLLGLALWCIARSVTDVTWTNIPLFIAACGLAMSAGFLAIFAPAGVGVREGILLFVLTGPVGSAAALVVVAARLIQTLAEVALAAGALAVWRWARAKGSEDAAPQG